MTRSILALALVALALPAGPALADPQGWHRNRPAYDSYDRSGRYREPRPLAHNDRIWRGRDGRYHCRRGNGTTGLIVGAGVGALIGRTIDTSGDRTLGTILGAAGGGLLGREVDRGNLRCR